MWQGYRVEPLTRGFGDDVLTSSNPVRISLAGVFEKTYANDILIKQLIAKVENPSAKSLYPDIDE